MDRPAGKPLRRARGAPGDRVGSRVRVRMRCERTTRRERGAAATTADELRVPPATVAYGGTSPGAPPALLPSGAGTPARAKNSPRSLAFSLAFLSGLSLSLSRLLRFAPAARYSDSSRWRSLSPSRVRPGGAGAGFPSARSLASPGFFSLLARETAVGPPPSGGTGREGHTEATGSIERTDAEKAAAAAAAHLLSARPVNPARERPLTTVSGAESALSPTDEKERHPKKKLRRRWRRLPAKAPTAADVYLDVTGGRKLERRLWPLRSRSAPTTPRAPRLAETG